MDCVYSYLFTCCFMSCPLLYALFIVRCYSFNCVVPIAVFQHKGVVVVGCLAALFSQVWHWRMPVVFVPPVNCTSQIVFCRVRVVIDILCRIVC